MIALACASWSPWISQASAQSAPDRSGYPADPAGPLLDMAMRHAEAGDVFGAEAYLRRAIGLEPNSETGYVRLAELHVTQQRPDRALEVFRLGLLRAPSSAEIWIGIARVLDGLGRRADAASTLQEFARRFPDAGEARLEAARYAEERGAWGEALAGYRFVRAHFRDSVPDDPNASTQVAQLERRIAALSFLVAGMDPVSARRNCVLGVSAFRRALAGCRGSPLAEGQVMASPVDQPSTASVSDRGAPEAAKEAVGEQVVVDSGDAHDALAEQDAQVSAGGVGDAVDAGSHTPLDGGT